MYDMLATSMGCNTTPYARCTNMLPKRSTGTLATMLHRSPVALSYAPLGVSDECTWTHVTLFMLATPPSSTAVSVVAVVSAVRPVSSALVDVAYVSVMRRDAVVGTNESFLEVREYVIVIPLDASRTLASHCVLIAVISCEAE
jgi:hypothetical protein